MRIYGPTKNDDPQRKYNDKIFKDPHFGEIQSLK